MKGDLVSSAGPRGWVWAFGITDVPLTSSNMRCFIMYNWKGLFLLWDCVVSTQFKNELIEVRSYVTVISQYEAGREEQAAVLWKIAAGEQTAVKQL